MFIHSILYNKLLEHFLKQALLFTCLQYKSFLNTVGKAEIAHNKQFLLFHSVFYPLGELSAISSDLKFFFANSFNLEESKICCFPNKPWFLRVCSKSLLKALWEKEKLLVMSNFSFSCSVFYPFGKLSAIFIKFKIVVCKLTVWKSLKFVVWETVKLIWY